MSVCKQEIIVRSRQVLCEKLKGHDGKHRGYNRDKTDYEEWEDSRKVTKP